MTDKETHSAIEQLTREIERLNRHKFIQRQNSAWRLILLQFGSGLAFGFGSIIGATFLMSLLAWWLSQFEFLPLIGEWLSQLVDQIEAIRTSRPQPVR